jgi:hypothetical protein
MHNCHISVHALFQVNQQIARQVEELHELQRQVREAEARVLGERSPSPETRKWKQTWPLQDNSPILRRYRGF